MSTAINHHGKWLIDGSTEWRQDLESIIGHKLEDSDDRIQRIKGNYGPPPSNLPQCNYCGSITPEDFVAAIKAGYRLEMADWKYGFPHKFYVHWPNPNPTEIRITGRQTVGDEVTKEWTGTYPTLHMKFYTEHLQSWPELNDHSELIEKATGILWEADGHVKWKGVKPPGVY